MGLQLKDLRVLWVSIMEGGAPSFFDKVFPGSIDEAAEYLRGLASEQDFTFGQVVDGDGRVLSNIAPTKK